MDEKAVRLSRLQNFTAWLHMSSGYTCLRAMVELQLMLKGHTTHDVQF